MIDVGTSLTVVAIVGLALVVAAVVLRCRGSDNDKSPEPEQHDLSDVYYWSGNPTEDQHRVLVDLSDDGRQAL